MAKTEITTAPQPIDKIISERFRQDLERDVQHAVHARRATLRLLQLKIHDLRSRLPAKIEGC